MSKRRVVITGMGVVCPLGNEVDTFWDRLLAGASGIARITRFDPTPFEVTFGGECREFDAQTLIDRRDAKRLDRFAQFAQIAGLAALKDSGLDLDRTDRSRVGVILGSGIGGLTELEEQHHRLLTKGPDRVSAFTIPKLMVNAASGTLSILFGARGPNTAVATACASATNAMGDALRAIRMNDADVVITGGSEAALTPLGVAAFAAMMSRSLTATTTPSVSRIATTARG